MKERPLADYWSGKPVPSERFNSDLEGFSDVVYPEWRKDQATAQIDWQGEVYWQRTKPLFCNKEVHLKRPTIDQIRMERGSKRII